MVKSKNIGLRYTDDTAGKQEVLYILFDQTCSLCTASVNHIKRFRSSAELRFVPLQLMEGEPPPLIPGSSSVSRDALYEKIHVFDAQGKLYAGADGIVRIMRTVVGLSWISFIYKIPGMSRIGDGIYRLIASKRYEWFGQTDSGCLDSTCEIPRTKPE